MTYYDILFSFFIYGFLGWCSEVAFAAFKQHSFVNRGFLNGPICPIYGIGVTVVVASLQPYVGNLILLYITSTILVTFLEWLTGFLLEKMFHHRWWDYSEMTRIIWQDIKDILLTPYIDLKTEYYDLGLVHRNETDDQVTVDSANATKKYGVAVKCATITPNAARMPEYNLKEMWKSPNGTIRAILDGTVFRTPILVKGITPYIPTWTKPITIARHAYGDVYKNVEMKCPAGSKAELVCTDKDGKETRETIYNFECDGIIQGQHNKSTSIASFARACFNFALDKKQDVWFATKDTISKKYDHTFKDIFQEIYDNEYKAKFEAAGIEYFYTLIDDAVARVIRSNVGYI